MTSKFKHTSIVILFLVLALFSCISDKKAASNRFYINPDEVIKMEITCQDQTIILAPDQRTELLKKMNDSKSVGPVKGIVRKKINIYTKANDTVQIRLLDNVFKWNKGGDWAYQLDMNKSDIEKICPANESQGNIDSLWNKLAFQKGGCLTGGQYIRNGRFGNEGCVLKQSKEWGRFFNLPKDELSAFLIRQLPDTASTKIHTCPFYTATNGELAVYCLQKVHNKNWYDFEQFSKYKNKETTGAGDNDQAWLQKILASKKRRNILISCFESTE
jgi:hypothetical protein